MADLGDILITKTPAPIGRGGRTDGRTDAGGRLASLSLPLCLRRHAGAIAAIGIGGIGGLTPLCNLVIVCRQSIQALVCDQKDLIRD